MKNHYQVVLEGRPVPCPRMTQRTKFTKPPVVIRYYAFRDFVAVVSNDNNLPKPLPWEEIAVKMELFIHGKVRGDIDNYAKSILDSFQRAGVIDNDKKVTFLQARIIEAPKDRERVLVTFEKVGGSYE